MLSQYAKRFCRNGSRSTKIDSSANVYWGMHSVVTAVFFRKVPSNVSAILGKLSTGKGAVVEAGVVEVVAMLVEVFVLLLWKQNYNLITGTKLALKILWLVRFSFLRYMKKCHKSFLFISSINKLFFWLHFYFKFNLHILMQIQVWKCMLFQISFRSYFLQSITWMQYFPNNWKMCM